VGQNRSTLGKGDSREERGEAVEREREIVNKREQGEGV
jgi:hypothetical protein